MANKRFPCPFCGKVMSKEDMVLHIEGIHEDMIPEGYTPLRITFNAANKKPMDYHGICTECKGPTDWDENKGRYNRQCGKKSCHDSFVRKFEENMMRVRGVTRISNTAEGQEKMLANRKISGKYRFADGGEKTYTGSYERKALEFMDQVLNCKSEDIMTPGPVLEYEFEGQTHFYISDILYIPYNLIIEVKDGGDRPNSRSMPEYRKKQIAKEEHIVKHTDYNYMRLTNNDFSQMLAAMMDLKMQLSENTGKRVIHINESMFSALGGMMPPAHTPDSAYVVSYLQNNVFAGEPKIAVSDSPKFDSLFYRDKNGKLCCGDGKAMLENCSYDVYRTENSWKKFVDKAKDKIGSFVTEEFIFESIYDKPMYSWDQIKFEPLAIPVPDLYECYNAIQEIVSNSIIYGGDNTGSIIHAESNTLVCMDVSNNKDDSVCTYVRIKDGEFFVEGMLNNNQHMLLNINNEPERRLAKVLGWLEDKNGSE